MDRSAGIGGRPLRQTERMGQAVVSGFVFEPIGFISSCFKEKFGIPRQPGLIPEARGSLEILPPFNRPDAFRELADYSHVWLTFVFHASLRDEWKPTVRPPRLGGNRRVGVFASRSPFRPNPIGLSVVRLEGMELTENRVCLHLGGIDLLEGTPVLDVKPYLPYADAIPDARSGYAPASTETGYEVRLSPAVERQLAALPATESTQLRRLAEQILALDPRPGYRRGLDEQRRYGMRLLDYELRWEVADQRITLIAIEPVATRTDP